MASQYTKPSAIKKYINAHGKRAGKDFLETFDRGIQNLLDKALGYHNGGRKTLDATIAGVVTSTQPLMNPSTKR